MRTENLAIAFVDIAGFTERTGGQSREDNERMLKLFADVVKPAASGFDGRVVKSMGDAFLLTFRSSTNALHCAMAIHDRLAERQTRIPEAEQIAIRVAINAGDVRIDGGDVFGEAVNIASRIESKAPAGEIYFSEAVYLAMTRAEVPSEEVGLTKLKGIADKVRLYRVPRVAEVGGYELSGVTPSTQSADPETGGLPFGGLGFARMSERPAAVEVIDRSRRAADTLLARTIAVTHDLRYAFMSRWRASQLFRRIVVGVVAAALVATIVAIAWPKPKPLTPWQKLQQKLGIDPDD
jgi:class 3 adenylate cyclase